jgi:poly(A) polymerase
LALDFEGNLIDPFGGLNDIKSKKIKAVGNPKERFLEDPSRILRGLRLASELGFEIEEKTKNSMAELKREILRKTKEGKTRVSEEIIAEEFLKGFYSAPKKMIELLNSVGVLKIILPEIAALKGVRQPEEFHTEGDVFEHTLLALQKLEELKKLIKLGRIKSPIPLLPDSIHTKLGLLFHDIGKPKTFKSKSETGDRIRFTGHDAIGAKMTGKICKRLKLSIFPKKDPLHVDIEKLVFLVKNHMICVNKNLEKMKLSTIEKYFFHPDKRGGELLTLSWADISATIPPGGNPDFTLFNKLISKLNEVKNVIFDKQKEKMVPYLLDGNEIMKILNLTPSPKVGKIKQEIRELQLKGRLKTKKEAINWLKKQKI